MATTSLRIYLHDIEGMIGAGQTDEAISHCMHILQTFPKNIAVYRLLGKAYLETQRYSDAADILQRVLSAMPDDFIANVGMSIIREDEGNLDSSIWHMERAFETQPYNSAIQDELRRLYGRRDGMEPPKIRLTRGALARLYMKGNLYHQAIGELRAALAEDPQRLDLQALLARVYYLSGQRIEAVEACSTLLKKLPYCMDANLLLGAILPETERAQDAQNYRQRAISLEPYFSQAPSNALTADNVTASAVMIDKLDYVPGKSVTPAGAQPSWATSLGVAFKEPKEEGALPEWLASTTEAPTEGETATEAIPPFQEARAPGAFPWEPSAEEAAPPTAEPAASDAIPDWMKEAGWGPSTGVAQEAPLPITPEEETETPVGTALAAEDIPDWLREAAPPGVLDQTTVPAEEKPTEEALPWLQENPPGPTDTIITWLSETKGEAPQQTEETPAVPLAETPQTPEEKYEVEIPDWLKENAPSAEIETPAEAAKPEETPDWMQPAEPTAEALKEEELPDWLKSPEAAASATPAELPDWLVNKETTAGEPAAEGELFAATAEEMPDWLRSETTAPETEVQPPAPVETVPAEAEEIRETPPEVMPTPTGEVEATPPAEEFPSWLKEVEAEIPDEAIGTPQLKGVTDWLEKVNTGDLATGPIGITDWLSNVEPSQEPPTPQPGNVAAGEVPEWLEGILATKQAGTEGGSEEPPAPPEEEMPEWLEPGKGEAPEAIKPEEGIPAIPAEEIPEWMKELQADSLGVPMTSEQPPAEAEITEEITPGVEAGPGEATPAFEAGLPPGVDLSDQEAALAWLEGLAAKQGVPEEELITKPEERAEFISPGAVEVPEEAPAAPAEAVPEWLKEVEAEVPEEAAPSIAPVSAEAVPPAEAGLPAGLDLSDQEAALAWLEGLAAKQGAPEEELITRPEERAEVTSGVTEVPEEAPAAPAEAVPEWLKAVEAEAPQVAPPEVEEVPTAPAEAVPEWLKAVEAEAPQVAPPEVEEAPAAPAEAVPEWLKEVEAEAPQVAPPEVEEVPAAPAEAVPEWLKEVEAEAPQVAPPEVEEVLAAPADAVPEWLKEVEAGAPEVVAAPEAETAPAVPAEGVPDWLKSAEAEAALEAAITREKEIEIEPSIPTETEAPGAGITVQPTEWVKETELPQWQEKAEVEKPMEKTEPEAELPGWIAEVAAEDSELAWVPPQTPEPEEKAPERTLTNLNSASIGELERLPAIGFVLAQSIINHRESRGSFTRIEDLLDVPGIGPGTIDVLRNWVTVEPVLMEVVKEEGAIPLDPDHVILKHAHDALQQGDISLAIKHYDQLLVKLVLLNDIILDLQDSLYRYPVDITIWQSLGDAYMRNNQLQDALDAYTKAEELLR